MAASADWRSWPPAIVVHELAPATAAAKIAARLCAGLHLRTPPGGAALLGLPWFHALDQRLTRDFPGPRRLVLDCGFDTGLATMALRRGIPVRSGETGATLVRLQDFAAANGCWVDDDPRPALDVVAQRTPERLIDGWITSWLTAGSDTPSSSARPA